MQFNDFFYDKIKVPKSHHFPTIRNKLPAITFCISCKSWGLANKDQMFILILIQTEGLFST